MLLLNCLKAKMYDLSWRLGRRLMLFLPKYIHYVTKCSKTLECILMIVRRATELHMNIYLHAANFEQS